MPDITLNDGNSGVSEQTGLTDGGFYSVHRNGRVLLEAEVASGTYRPIHEDAEMIDLDVPVHIPVLPGTKLRVSRLVSGATVLVRLTPAV